MKNIAIDKMVKLSDRYLLLQPNLYDLREIIESSHDGWQDGDFEILMEACSITCIVDKQTGTLYKIPRIGLGDNYSNNSVIAVDGISYFNGNYGPDDIVTGVSGMQIFKFNPNDLTVAALLPEYQDFDKFTVNNLGYVGYYGHVNSPFAKVKCPGGSIIALGSEKILTISNTFYTLEGLGFEKSGIVKKWSSNGDNSLTSAEVCSMPKNTGTLMLANQLQNVYLFYGHTGQEVTYKFDGEEFTLLDVVIPQDLYTVSFETKDAWYNADNSMMLRKLSKVDYSITTIDISGYQIIDYVATVDSPDVSFTGIRYSDSKKVIGKITSNNDIVIESAFTSGSNIYNLIPINLYDKEFQIPPGNIT